MAGDEVLYLTEDEFVVGYAADFNVSDNEAAAMFRMFDVIAFGEFTVVDFWDLILIFDVIGIDLFTTEFLFKSELKVIAIVHKKQIRVFLCFHTFIEMDIHITN